MLKNLTLLLMLVIGLAGHLSAQVVINEFSPDPSVGDSKGAEWVELYNPSASNVDIGGWVVTSGSNPGTMTTGGYSVIMPTGLVMPPNSFLVISNSNLMSCNTCDYPGLHTRLGLIPSVPTGATDFASGKADAAFLDLATCNCANSASGGCTSLPGANTTFVLNNADPLINGERLGLFNNSGTLVDATFYELGNDQRDATLPIITDAGLIGAYNNPNNLTLPATSDPVYVNLGKLLDGCSSSYNRVPDGGSWGLNSAPSRTASGGNQTTATDQPTPGYKNDYSDNGSPNQQPFNFFADNVIIGDAEDVRTGANLIYGTPSDYIHTSYGTAKPVSTGNRRIVSCSAGGGTIDFKYENYNFQHVEENSVLAGAGSGTGSTTLAGTYITVGIDGATPTAAPANSNGTMTGTSGWTEQGGSSGLAPGNMSILPDATTGVTTLTKSMTLPTANVCEVKTALYNLITRNYGNSLLCSAARVGTSSVLLNPVGISNATSSDCWEGASYLVTIVGPPAVPATTANTAFVCPGRLTNLSGTPCTYTIPTNADVTLTRTVEFYDSPAVTGTNGAPTGNLLTNPVTVPAGGNYTVYAFTKVVATKSNTSIASTGSLTCYSAAKAHVIADDPACLALPVELVSFDAREKGSTVEVTWATASESNSDKFEIERSATGLNNSFEVIGTIKAAGNSISYIKYNYLDKNPIKGDNYYRLKQTDLDGKVEHSNIRNVIFERGLIKATVVPNPANESARFVLNTPMEEDALVWVYDMLGRVVIATKVAEGGTEVSLDLSTLPSGNYTALLHNTKIRLPYRFTKK